MVEVSQTKISSWTITTAQKKKILAKKATKNPKVSYLPTKVKARNFLSNIAYSRISREDFDKNSFIIDVFTYLVLDLKPFFCMRLIRRRKIGI